MEKFDIYEKVTQRIMEQLEKGIIPWRKPWRPNVGADAGICDYSGQGRDKYGR